MVATGIEHLIAHDGGEEFGEGHRTPDYDDRQGQKPLQDADILIDVHHFQACQRQKDRDEKGRETETTSHEEPREKGSHRPATVAKLALGVQPLARPHVEYQTLVGLTRGKERYEGDDHVDGQQQQNESENEIENVVLEDILDAQRFGERCLLAGLFFLCHECGMNYFRAKVIDFRENRERNQFFFLILHNF